MPSQDSDEEVYVTESGTYHNPDDRLLGVVSYCGQVEEDDENVRKMSRAKAIEEGHDRCRRCEW